MYLSSISEGADQLDQNPLVIQELSVNVDNSIHGVRSSDMINKVTPAKIKGYFAIRRGFLKDSKSNSHDMREKYLKLNDITTALFQVVFYGFTIVIIHISREQYAVFFMRSHTLFSSYLLYFQSIIIFTFYIFIYSVSFTLHFSFLL